MVDLTALLEEIKVARLQPGDVILAKAREKVEGEDAEYIVYLLKRTFPDHEVLLLDGVDIEVVRPVGDQCAYGHIRTWTSAVCQVCGDLLEDPLPAPLVADPDMIHDLPMAGT